MTDMKDGDLLTKLDGEHNSDQQEFQLAISKSQKKKLRQRSKAKGNYITMAKVACFKPLQWSVYFGMLWA